MEWYYVLGIISYGIFIIQFGLSFLGFGDLDIDIDLDGDVDFDISDLLSFKGLIHFLMGFSGWLMAGGTVNLPAIVAAILMGFVFMIMLYLLYKICMKFNTESTIKTGIKLIGTTATVYVPYLDNKYICLLKDGREIVCTSEDPLEAGNTVRINDFVSEIYYVSLI